MHRFNDTNPWAPGDLGAERVRRQRRGHGGRRGSDGRGGPAGPLAGPPAWIDQMFGPQWGGPGGRRGGHRPRVRRGDVRPAILDVLGAAEQPLNGYQVIQQIADRTDDAWRPSPGSVYPTIAQLVDEGLVEDAPEGRKTLRLTEAGRSWLADNADAVASVWAVFDRTGPQESDELRQVIGQTVGAIVQVASAGTPGQQARAAEILAETRRQLYGLLAEGPEAS